MVAGISAAAAATSAGGAPRAAVGPRGPVLVATLARALQVMLQCPSQCCLLASYREPLFCTHAICRLMIATCAPTFQGCASPAHT